METLNMYQIPRSIMHDPLQNHVPHHFVTFSLDHFVTSLDHFVTFSLDLFLLPIRSVAIARSVVCWLLHCSLHCCHCTLNCRHWSAIGCCVWSLRLSHIHCSLRLSSLHYRHCTVSCRHWSAIDCSVWLLQLPALYDCFVWSLHYRHWSIHKLRPWYEWVRSSVATMVTSVTTTDQP